MRRMPRRSPPPCRPTRRWRWCTASCRGRRTLRYGSLLQAKPGATLRAAHAAGRPRHDRQVPVHVGLDQAAQGRDQHAPHVVRQPADAAPVHAPFWRSEPPVLVDWLPWNHTFGGNHNVGITLDNGGTLYIDDGKPTPGGIAETLRNLREISPTVYFNVPKGFEEIARAMDSRCAAAPHAVRARARPSCSPAPGLTPGGVGPARRARRGHHRRAAARHHRARHDRDRAVVHVRRRHRRPLGPDRPAGAGRRGEAGARRRQDRDPLPRSQRDAGLLACAGADARRVRRRGLLPHRRRGALGRRGRPAARPAVRRPHRRGLQALHRHLRQRRARCARASSPPATRACRTR